MRHASDGKKPKPRDVQPGVAEERSQALPVTPWKSYSFAPEWYQDALHEAKVGHDHASRRREILFAVCCVESYLFEWVRDDVLHRDFTKLSTYFPQRDRIGIRERWKKVIRDVYNDGLICGVPDFNTSSWSDFTSLVDYRDGLVHGKSSRPDTHALPQSERPLPSKPHLDNLSAGCAVKVIDNLIRALHRASRTNPPSWVDEP